MALPVLARRVADAGWSGLAWAVGVPGSVGGAVRMNAGGHGSDMASCLVRYTWVDLFADGGGTDDVARLAYGYRSSSVTTSQLVVEAELAVTPGSVEAEQDAVSAIVQWRREHQPGGSNAGSVFTNPEGDSAGRLIEAAGLKGYRIGTAHVSEKHANFIQADKGRPRRRRACADGARARRRRRALRGRAAHRGPSPRLRRREDWSRCAGSDERWTVMQPPSGRGAGAGRGRGRDDGEGRR